MDGDNRIMSKDIKISDWHNDSNLVKAKALITDKNNNFTDVSAKTGIKYNTLMGYRKNIKTLENARGKIWNLLAQYHDQLENNNY